MTNRISTGVAIAYALTMTIMVFFLTKVPATLGEVVFVILVIVWTSLPVTGLLFPWPRSPKLLIVTVPSILFAGYAYLDMLVLSPDAQSPLGLIFIPIYQSALTALVWGLDALVRLALRKAAK
ncbi:hypothetical protein [Sphingomonas sp.]|uniref:hypothetical protein n=1 Tax=Sphingomonas sp. TaxID=28214 RepID=UPI003752D849